MSEKKSFILYLDFYDQLSDLSVEQAGHLLKSMYAYHKNEEYLVEDKVVKFALKGLVSQFKRDNDRWESIRAKRSDAGKCGAKQKLANAGKRKQKVANQAVSVSVSGSVSVNDNEDNTPLTPQRGEEKNKEEMEWSLELSRTLRDGVERKAGQRLISKAESGSFIKLLRRGISKDQIERAVDFVIENYGKEYFPVIHGSVSFFKKWDKIVEAKRRNQQITGNRGATL